MGKAVFALIKYLEIHWFWSLFTLLLISTGLWVVQLSGEGFELPLAVFRGIFYSLQFIVLNKDLDGVTGVLLAGLTFTQLTLPVLASAAVLGALFREHMRPIWIRKFANKEFVRHHIIIGYGDLGKALAFELMSIEENERTTGSREYVIAIDINELDRQEHERLIVLRGDARDSVESLFSGSRIEVASSLYLMLPDEKANLELLARVKSYIDSNVEIGSLKIFVRAASLDLNNLFMDYIGLESMCGSEKCDIRPVSVCDAVARGVVNEYSPDCYIQSDKEGGVSQTVLIVGTSEMAQALIRRFARVGIYSAKGKLRVVWVGDNVSDVANSLYIDYPSLNPKAYGPHFFGWQKGLSQSFYELNLPSIELIPVQGRCDLLVRGGVVTQITDGAIPAVIYLCHESNVRNAKEARDLQAAFGVAPENNVVPQQLILALQPQRVLGIKDGGDWTRYKIKEEGVDQYFARALANDRADHLAIKFKELYDNKAGTWIGASFFEKESNRDAADHAAIKARYAGMDKALVEQMSKGLGGAVSEAELLMESVKDDIYLMEQRRYRAFMFMAGYRHASNIDMPKMISKNEWLRGQRINPTLLQEKLSEFDIAKDSNIIKITTQAFQGAVSS